MRIVFARTTLSTNNKEVISVTVVNGKINPCTRAVKARINEGPGFRKLFLAHLLFEYVRAGVPEEIIRLKLMVLIDKKSSVPGWRFISWQSKSMKRIFPTPRNIAISARKPVVLKKHAKDHFKTLIVNVNGCFRLAIGTKRFPEF